MVRAKKAREGKVKTERNKPWTQAGTLWASPTVSHVLPGVW